MTTNIPDAVATLLGKLRAGPPPEPWREVRTFPVDGLWEVGFVRDTERLLVVSAAGRGLFDGATGESLARDTEEPSDDWHDDSHLEAVAIGPDAGTTVSLAGLHGGGLPSTTSDGWSLQVMAPRWPDFDVVLEEPSASLFMEAMQPGRHLSHCVRIARAPELRASGFSHTGRTLVLASATQLVMWHRD